MTRLICQAISKRYGATHALRGLDLDVGSGHVVGIAGPNGAGKSTLMRMLAGEESPDSGTIELTTAQVRAGEISGDVWRRVAVVHQEPHIWPNMTVEQNLVVGRETRWFGTMRPDPLRATDVLSRLDIEQYAKHEVADLSLAVQQRVEIARAMLRDADVYLFDEPNSALTELESEALFSTMDGLAKEGKIVMLITHRLNDFVRCCREVLVLRDGRIAGHLRDAEISETAIAAALTMQDDAVSRHNRKPRLSGPVAAEVAVNIENWSDPKESFMNVTLRLDAGRIFALAGVEGSGARELAQAIGCFIPVNDKDARPVRQLASLEVSYLAASRRQTVFHNMSVGENLLTRLGKESLNGIGGLLSPSRMKWRASANVERYRVKTGSIGHPITSLSGGNQQKVVLGALMEKGSRLIVIEEPTRGVDISSKAEIYQLLREYADRGGCVIVYCTEVQEIFEAADEAIVLSRGSVVGQLELDQFGSIPELADWMARLENTETLEVELDDLHDDWVPASAS